MQRKAWYYEKWGGRQASFYQIWSVKGKLFSKCFMGSSISSKKQTNEFVFTSMQIVFVPFLEEIDDLKKTFQN